MNYCKLITPTLLLILCIGLAESSPDREKRQANTVTSTSTESVTTTLTFSVTIKQVCAQLVNVTGVCRRRRGLFYEEPIVMYFDEGFDDVEEYFNPTAPLSMETTERVALPVLSDSIPWNTPSENEVRSSQATMQHKSHDYAGAVLPRIFFAQIIETFNNLFSTVTESTTVTTLVTEFETSSIFSTGTFFVSRCTPSPFPYSTC